MTQPMTRAQITRLRQEDHREKRIADFTARLGEWGVILAWVEEAKAVAKAEQRKGNQTAVVELARTLENFCARYRP
ncbi:hypothetical protein ACODT4_44675 [Streptomyces sp. 2.9]|uniref:hypothetical protein n=1 Tax=Streptomyces tritrimontium TaxID=3406573 RepID=UPI003BB5D96A